MATPFSTHVRLVSPHEGSTLASPATEFRLDEFENVTFRTVNAAITNPYNTPDRYVQTIVEEKEKVKIVKAATVESQSPATMKKTAVTS